jgi:hypothetical protein
MTTETEINRPVGPAWRRWIRRGFLTWAIISTLWLANSYRTRGLADDVLQSSPTVSGYPVFIVKLPFRFAPLESQKQTAVERATSVTGSHPEISQWVLSGHSLGGALACRAVRADPTAFSAMVLVGTTHPKMDDLSSLTMQVTKVYASNDGIAPKDKILSNKRLLPKDTQWVEIEGGNHSQFGHYGHQLFDGKATVSREAQQAATRSALLETLTKASR